MSYFKCKAILAVIISFHASSSFGMDIHSNSYFDPNLQKTLLLLMAKNNDSKTIDLGKDEILVIATKNYDLHCDELFKSKVGEQSFKQFWKDKLNNFNDATRIQTCYGQKIEIDDFDFMIMNNQGRKIFLNSVDVISNYKNNNVQSPNFSSDITTSREQIKQDRENNQLYWTTDDEYNEMSRLPLQLRSKIGNLCPIVIGKEQFSYKNYFVESSCYEGLIGAGLGGMISLPIGAILWFENNKPTDLPIVAILMIPGLAYGIGSYHIQKTNADFPTPLTLLCSLFKEPKIDMKIFRKKIDREFKLEKKPLVPEKYTETLKLKNLLKEGSEKHFQLSKANLAQHQQKTAIKLIARE